MKPLILGPGNSYLLVIIITIIVILLDEFELPLEYFECYYNAVI